MDSALAVLNQLGSEQEYKSVLNLSDLEIEEVLKAKKNLAGEPLSTWDQLNINNGKAGLVKKILKNWDNFNELR